LKFEDRQVVVFDMSKSLTEDPQKVLALLEERFFPLFEHAAVGFAKVGLDCRWLRVNRKLCEMTGYTENELLGMTFCDITHVEDLEADLANMKAVMAGELGINSMEKRYICKDGAVIWIHLTATLVKDQNDLPDYFITIIEDITDRKEMETALIESERRHHLVLEGSNDGVWDWNLITDEVYWNNRFYEIIGLSREIYPPDAQLGWELIHPDDRQMVRDEVQRHLEQGIKYQLQFRMRHSSGEYRHVLARAESLRNEQGVPVRMAGVYTDITDQVKAQEALRESEERYRTIVETAYDGIWEWDMRTNEVFWNDRLYEMHGYNKENFKPTYENFLGMVHPDERSAVQQALIRHLESGHPFEMEMRKQHQSGEYRVFLARGAALRDERGIPYRMSGVNIDITERKLAEQAIKDNEERFSMVIDSSNDGLYDWDLKIDKPYWNARYFEMLGYEPDEFEVSYEKYVELIHPDDRERAISAIQSYMQRPGSYETEYRMRHKSGQYLHVVCRGGTLFQDGKPVRLLGLVRDVSSERRSREALEQSESRLRRVVDSDIIGLVFWNKYPGGITDANDAFLQMVGYTREEMLSGQINWRNMTPPEYLPLDEAAFNQMDNHPKGKCEPYEKQYIAKDGRRIDILLAVAYYEGLKDSGVAFILDITKRKQAERALKESEERFRGLADASPFMVWMTDPDGHVNYHSKKTLEFTGLTVEETIQQDWLERIHPEDKDGFVHNFLLSLQTKSVYQDEMRAMRHDGEYRWLLTMGIPRFNSQNQFLGYIGSTLDITDRKMAELKKQKNLEKERLLRRIMEIISQSFNLDSILNDIVKEVACYFNADRCGLLRYSIENGELIVKLSKQYSPEFPPLGDDEIPFKSLGFLKQNVLKDQEPDIINIASMEDFARESRDYFEKYNLPAEQYIAEMEALFNRYSVKANLAVEIYYQGMPYGMIGLHQCTSNRLWTEEEVSLLRDIAAHVGVAFSQVELFQQEQKARTELENYAKKLEISNRELEQFATIASHDLQEPLRKVRIFSQMMASHCNEEGRIYIDRVQNATSRMQNLISDLLVLSRINRKGNPFQHTSLSHCVQNTLDDLEVMIQELQPEIIVESLIEIEADAKQIEQLFLNLIGNALKFQRAGETPKIHIAGKILSDKMYEITVQDNGIGFDEQYRERIFEPFERLNGSNGQYPGTGMGLAIARKIVERHGGSIEAQSQSGQGATFIIRLPIYQNN
jgi:PAS domain S-box-containing protein